VLHAVVNPCDPKFNLCDDNATCTAEYANGKLTLIGTCSCKPGFDGNGVNPSASMKRWYFVHSCEVGMVFVCCGEDK